MQSATDSPRLGVKTLAQTRLCEQLDKSLKRDVTIVVAPAGFGKSVLLADWMAHCTLPTAWLSLDANDNQLPTFARYLALAVERIFPDGCRETLNLSDALLPPDPALLVESLLSEMGNLPKPFVLVLDDYHVIENQWIHALVTSLIDHLPKRPYLILGSRNDPPLPLSQGRGRRQRRRGTERLLLKQYLRQLT